MTKFLAVAAAALLSTAIAAPANAAILTFTLSGDYSAVFQIDSSPVVDLDHFDHFHIYEAAFPGASGLADLAFYDSSALGGLGVQDIDTGVVLVDAGGPQLFTGTTANPTFRTGTFALSGFGGESYTLTIAGVPEPASWAMMIGGIGAAGGALRRRKANVSIRYA